MNFTPNQLKAINTTDKNLKIVACAGSGKTRTVTERIIQLLKSGKAKPENIVAFTFTEKAAGELKGRIFKRIKEEFGTVTGLAEMYIGTIHSYCLRLLQGQYPEYQKYRVLDDIKTRLFIERNWYALDVNSLPLVNPGPKMASDRKIFRYKETNVYIGIINILRENLVEHKTLPDYLKEALEKYDSVFDKEKYFDFTMIMQRAIEKLAQDPVLKAKIASTLKYLTVDEYQDVNPIQEKLISLLHEQGANLCVVGDDDQTIYEWRGSDIENILTFEQRYPNAVKVDLNDNFRSSKGVVKTASSVIARNDRRENKQMNAAAEVKAEKGDIIYECFDAAADEFAFIADRIAELKTAGYKQGDMVILTRSKKLTPDIVSALETREIDFIVEDVNELFSTHEGRAAKGIFQYINGEINADALLALWQNVSKQLTQTQIKNAIKAVSTYTKDKYGEKDIYFKLLLQRVYHDFLEALELTEPESEIIPEIEIVHYNLGKFSQVIEDFESIYYRDRPIKKMEAFCKFLEFEAEDYYPEGHLQNQYLRPDAVRIMTIHQAKGLEFPVVFVPLLSKGKFPVRKAGGISIWHYLDKALIPRQERFQPEDVEAERRLFYVAMTRSKKLLILTRSDYYSAKQASPESVFLAEAKKSPFVEKFGAAVDFTKKPPLSEAVGEAPAIVLNFSVLQDFYACPYRFKMSFFYGFLQPVLPQMGYGRSLHDIVMAIHRQFEATGKVTKEDIPAMIDDNFYLPYATGQMADDMKAKGTKAIIDYFKENHENFDKIEFSEKEIEIDLGQNIRVTGRIDLVRRLDNYDEPTTYIVDFKTVDPAVYQGVGEEQLKIYALGYNALTGRNADYIEFYNLEENDRQSRQLQNDDLENAKTRIVQAANEIRANQLQKNCSQKTCATCYMAHLCLNKKKRDEFGVEPRKKPA